MRYLQKVDNLPSTTKQSEIATRSSHVDRVAFCLIIGVSSRQLESVR